MKLKHTRAIVALTLAAFGAPALADGAVNALLGARPLKNKSYWGGRDGPGGLGLAADVALGPTLPVWLNVGGQYFGDGDDKDATINYEQLSVGELSLGLKLMPQSGWVRPYAGAGIQRDWVSYQRGLNNSDSDKANGWYAEGGAMFWIGRHFDVGLNLRWIKDTHVKLYGNEGDLDGRGYSVVAGYTWGAAPAPHHERKSGR